jgi:hypothetical protein
LFNRLKFTLLLLTLLLLLVAHPLLDNGSVMPASLYPPLRGLVHLAAVGILFQRPGSRIGALVFGLPTLAGIVAHYLWPGAPPSLTTVMLHFFPAVLIGFTVIVILRTIFQVGEVSADSINGAFCGYVLLGLAFGHLYCVVESFRPGSFHLQEHVGTLPDEDGRRHALLTYFSLITLTTVGYGDITPQSGPARTFAWVEAVIGQFYVAVIIAELIALKVSAAIRDRRGDPPGTAPP